MFNYYITFDKVDIDTISVKDEFLKFFELHSKSENQQTENENRENEHVS